MQKNAATLCPTKLDRAILDHIRQYGLTTFEVLKQVFFADKSIAALKSTLRRLCGPASTYQFLASAPLTGKRVYYHLTQGAVKFLGCSSDLAIPLGPQARYHRFAVLAFVHCHGDRHCVLFDPTRFPDIFPLRGHRLNRNDFFIEGSHERPRLGAMIVDHGAHPRRIVAKTMRRLARFLRNRWFDEFIQEQNFTMTILTPSDGKRASILPLLRQAVRVCLARPKRDGLDQRVQRVDFRVEVVPGLQELLPAS